MKPTSAPSQHQMDRPLRSPPTHPRKARWRRLLNRRVSEEIRTIATAPRHSSPGSVKPATLPLRVRARHSTEAEAETETGTPLSGLTPPLRNQWRLGRRPLAY